MSKIGAISINGIDLSDVTTDIMFSGTNRSTTSNFIRGSGSQISIGKYAETSLAVILQIDVEEIVGHKDTPENPHEYVKLLCEVNNYPFCFIRSAHIEKFLSTTADSENRSLVFGIMAIEVSMAVAMQGAITVSLQLQYFNHNPFCSDIEFTSFQKVPDQSTVSKTKAIGEKKKTEYRDFATDEINESGFKRYFLQDYRDAVVALSKYKGDVPMSKMHLDVPIFEEEKPSGKDYEVMTISKVNTKGTVDNKEVYVSWHDDNQLSSINNDRSCTQTIVITKMNNFASHSMSGIKFPVLQYMGKGVSRVQLSLIGDDTHAVLEVIKAAMRTIDVNERNSPKYSQFNVLKLRSFITDLFPVFGLVPERESCQTSSANRGAVPASMVFLCKDNRSMIAGDSSVFTRSANEGNDLDFERIKETLKKILEEREIPLDERVERKESLKQNSRSEESKYRKMTMPKGVYPELLELLDKNAGIEPGTLYNLMYQESRGKADATNPSGAVGAFQFMKPTAEEYGLKDRTDAKASAIAASNYMKYLKNRFGDDSLALAAYNWGPGNVSKALRRGKRNGQKAKTWNDIVWSAPKETRDYVRDIRSATQIDSSDTGLSTDHRRRSSLLTRIDKDQVLKDIETQAADPLSLEGQKARIRVEEEYIALVTDAHNGEDVLSAYLASDMDYIEEQVLNISNPLRGEVYSDLSLGGRLMNTTPVIGESGEIATDARDINPFFFMDPKPYITPSIVRGAYSSTSQGLADAKDRVVDLVEGHMNKEREGSEYKTMKTLNHTGSSDIEVQKVLSHIYIHDEFERIDNEINAKVIQSSSDLTDEEVSATSTGAESEQARMQCEREGAHFARGANLAFPALKIYIVIGDETLLIEKLKEAEHSYYSLDGIVGATLACQNDDSPVDVLLFTVANPGSIYSDSTVIMDRMYLSKNWKAQGTSYENEMPTDRLIIRPGTRIHAKAGYSNDPNKLETMFNGVVSEVSGTAVLQVVCEGFGRELISHDHGNDPTEDLMNASADTVEVLGTMLYMPEIEHFGQTAYLVSRQGREAQARKPFLFSNIISSIGSNQLFSNVYINNVLPDDDLDYSFSLLAGLPFSDRPMFYHYPIFKATPWSVFKEMEFRHAGSLAKAPTYGDRQTFFYGVKEQLYVFRDLSLSVQTVSSSTALYDKVKSKRYKPISDFHVASTDLNIIHNGLKVGSDFNTAVTVRYFDDDDAVESSDFEYKDMQLDDNLMPMAIRYGRCEMPGTNGLLSSFSYGSTYLRKEAEKMYSGKIILLGNENIKSGDYMVVYDGVRDMNGMVKVRECIHSWDVNSGYITEVTPGLFVESTHTNYSLLFPKLYMAYLPVLEAVRSVAIEKGTMNARQVNLSTLLHIAGLTSDHSRRGLGNIFDQYVLNQHAASVAGIWLGISLTIRPLIYSGIAGLSAKAVGGAAAVKAAAAATAALGASELTGLSLLAARASAMVGMASARILPFVARAILTIGGPIAFVGVSLFISAMSSAVREYTLTRQPVRIMPLTVHGRPYIGGIYGYNEGGVFEDVWSNVSKNLSEIQYIAESIGG